MVNLMCEEAYAVLIEEFDKIKIKTKKTNRIKPYGIIVCPTGYSICYDKKVEKIGKWEMSRFSAMMLHKKCDNLRNAND